MTVAAMFEVGSSAKQFIAVAILQLRDAGKLSLDDDITKWLTTLRVRGGRPPLRRMLSHTSGMSIDGPGLSIRRIRLGSGEATNGAHGLSKGKLGALH